ncbi:MAG TPA: NAD-dependent dihydropyrimidine dehydrogenase subunit PreA [Candidatus Sumerlaeota bacterium]|nr:NAD-dependent dihydropyrimidine dehydrogenase subunit PreA [Candidatus Sumerlaeota bacterium]
MPDLRTTFCGITFENPFVLAAAPPTDDLDMLRRGYEAGWAGAVLKTTSVPGTPVILKYPMITGIEWEGRSLAAMGNIDLISEHHADIICERIAVLKKEFPEKITIGSIMGSTRSDWQTLVGMLEEAGADAIECSFSCPQGTLGSKPGAMLGQDLALVEEVTRWIKSAAKRCPVIIKLTPQVSDIVDAVLAVKRGGGDAVCASNTIPSLMGINLDTLRPIPDVSGKTSYSGLSGPAIKPVTLRVIAEICRHTDMPVTSTGGASDWRDAVEFLLVGARNVQVCTAVMKHGFRIIEHFRDGLSTFMEQHGFERLDDFIGRSLQYITTHDQLPPITKGLSVINQKTCVKCGRCFVACRDGGHMAIEMDKKRRVKVLKDRCVGCGLCVTVCPVSGCIHIEPDVS